VRVIVDHRAGSHAGTLDEGDHRGARGGRDNAEFGEVDEKNAGSTFGAALRGGDLVCKGDVGARVGIDMKGGSIIIGGRAGAFCGFMSMAASPVSARRPTATRREKPRSRRARASRCRRVRRRVG
jgi:formylmethanofuran dehydrogenase subunit C